MRKRPDEPDQMVLMPHITTLEKWWSDQFNRDGKATISRRTVQRWAKNDAIPGAFKPKKSRIWLIDLAAWTEANRRLLQPSIPEIPILPHRIQDQKAVPPGKKLGKAKKGDIGDGFDNFDISRKTTFGRTAPAK